jgi:hypothetical protein
MSSQATQSVAAEALVSSAYDTKETMMADRAALASPLLLAISLSAAWAADQGVG